MTCSGLPVNLLAQLGVLRGDADRARVEVALAHHDAARRDERRGGEAELLGAEQRGEDDVAPGLELAVDLQAHAPAQAVHHEHLLRLGEAELPRRAGVLDRRERRGAGAAVVPADEDDVGVRLGDARGDGADARLGHQLHADARARVDVLQIEDELREILDRVDVVVRRRRDERHARRRVAHARDDRVDLVPGELSAFAGLGALGHLDLQLVGVDQVVRGHAEARRRDLLDRAAPRVAVRVAARSAPGPRRPRRCSTCRRCGSSRWRGSRAPLWRCCRTTSRRWRSACTIAARRLDLVERHRRARRARSPSSPRSVIGLLALLVDEPRVLLVARRVLEAHRLLQRGDGLRVPQVPLAGRARQ